MSVKKALLILITECLLSTAGCTVLFSAKGLNPELVSILLRLIGTILGASLTGFIYLLRDRRRKIKDENNLEDDSHVSLD
jgi:hypothetical protein